MSDSVLSPREQLILQAVVHQYITTADPVGSRALVKRYSLDISPATVRNVMSDLEDAGYLQQLHTSSGRVPTDTGYRYYVDYLMNVQEVAQSERIRIENDLRTWLDDTDEILRQTSHLLALVTNQPGIVEQPDPQGADVRRIDLMPIDGNRTVVLIADNYGRVRTHVITIQDALGRNDLEKLTQFLNNNLAGTPTNQLGESLHAKLKAFVDEQRTLAERAVTLLERIPQERTLQLFLEGTTQLFEQPEFRDIRKAREVFGILEEDDRVAALLRAGMVSPDRENLRVLIGAETPEGIEDISVVSASYSIGNRPAGMLGVIGPRRMPYSRLSGIVQYTASKLSGMLTRLAG